MDMGERDHSESPENVARRACNQCRLRKIRCDKDVPCSNCKTADRPCSTTGAGQRPKEARQRVLISTQYERKIDQFESRLAGIEGMLRDLTVSLAGRNPSVPASTAATAPSDHNSPSGSASRTSNTTGTPSSITRDGVSRHIEDRDGDFSDDENLDSAFEGNSSMAAQTVFASDFLQSAVTRDGEHNPDMESALSSLHQIVALQNRPTSHESHFENVQPLPKGGFRDLPMPPLQLVVSLLRELKESPPVSFTLMCSVVMSDKYNERCRRVYFATEDFSLTSFAIVNSGLYFLFQEKAWSAEGARKVELRGYQDMCRDNLETALANLPMLMPERRESVDVLLMGATYAVEISKFTLAWRLNSAAAIICQTLGYHRISPSGKIPTVEEQHANNAKQASFWFTYLIDRALSLRFGRASAIQDYDITIPRTLGHHMVSGAWADVFNQWIMHAEFMGKAYENLYSPAALARQPEQRVESARQLIGMLQAVAGERNDLNQQIRMARGPTRGFPEISVEGVNPYSIDMCAMSDHVIYHSAMTLIHRAIPSPPGSRGTFNAECIDAARSAFESHHDCMRLAGNNLNAMAGYMHWTVLYVPFVPVIVLFCNIIETSDTSDLSRLEAFTNSLQAVSEISKATDKFWRVCQVLCNVARIYMEAKTRQEQDQDMNLVGNDIDMYLSQLGFMPQHGQVPGNENGNFGDSNVSGIDMDANQNSRLGNWFSGNRHIFGLVEEDLSDFEPKFWLSPHGVP
ncbi:hypothetical protein B0T25DRAFT_67577 [Lasiosphaeria hispida]|uniref:Zn(2)-C6 fungal-type domain-containing protein n=1 Tax=Lasiosphaeria hispida TaxID=260671 RepID=A0AAJ0ML55_9PEZI|nr:hypothetical protein B0T25DRAFT_67577 [Lasiosphaeria hispida]